MKRTLTTFLLVSLACTSALAQVRESAGGGGVAASGAGRAYEAAGSSSAGRGLQRKMNSTLLKAISRERASTTKKTVSQGTGKPTKRPVAPKQSTVATPAPADLTSTFFKPQSGSDVDTFDFIAKSITTNPAEQQVFNILFQATKEGFEKEVAKKGRSNNITAAFTLFIATSLMVYHNDPEPSDAAIDVLWDGLGSALGETPELAEMSDSEKEQIYDTLIALSGILLAGHLEGKKPENRELAANTRNAAGILFETVLKTDPKTLRFTKTGLETVK